MAENYSVKATLSAADRNFTSTMKNAQKSCDSLGSKLKSGLSFGIFTGIGQRAFDTLVSGAGSLITEIDSSNAAWKTFSKNMQIIGKSDKEISGVQKTLQKFAEKTIYSSSDMATTYAQLEAVGVKATDKLVTGFGGLAAAAENPQQAMKTLSMQATQMAAKPKVAWQDFKLMLEQTPAGIAAVAKEMGMSTSELVSKVQDGKVKTEDFFNAIKKVGNNKDFSKLATEAKTVGQAMDGLKETVGNKLTPAFDVMSQLAIKGVNKIADALGDIDGQKIAKDLSTFIKKATPYWKKFCSVAKSVAKVLKKVIDFFLDHSEAISKTIPYILGAVAAYKGFKVVKSAATHMSNFAKSISKLTGSKMKGLGKNLDDIAGGTTKVGDASAQSSQSMLASAKAFMMIGAGVLMAAGGFSLLALSAVQLANAGPLAIGVMFGLVAALGALTVGIMAFMKTISSSPAQIASTSKMLLALGAAVLLVSAGFLIMSYAATNIANAGAPAIAVFFGMVAAIAALTAVFATFSTQLTAGATGFIALGAALLMAAAAMGIMALSAVMLANAGTPAIIAMVALTACLAALVAIFAVMAPALTAGAVGLLAFGAAILLVGAGALLASVGLMIVANSLPLISQYGLQSAINIALLGAALIVFAVGALAAGVAIVALSVGLAAFAVTLTLAAAGSLLLAAGLLALGVGGLVAGVGMALVMASLATVTALLPLAASSSLLLAAGFVALLASSAGVSATLLLATAALLALSGGMVAAVATTVAFAAGMIAAVAAVAALALALKLVNSSMKSIANNAKTTAKSLLSMKKSISVVESGLKALGDKAKAAVNKLISAFKGGTPSATAAGTALANGFNNGLTSGFLQSPAIASIAIQSVYMSLNSGSTLAYAAGANISKGFAQGMLSQLSTIEKAAAKMAAAADKAVKAKAKIHSPSRVAKKEGGYWGSGLALGMLDKVKEVWKAAQKLIDIPVFEAPSINFAYAGVMSSDYEYYRNNEYTVVVPVEIDGKEVAKVTAPYTEEELNKRQRRENRKNGKV